MTTYGFTNRGLFEAWSKLCLRRLETTWLEEQGPQWNVQASGPLLTQMWPVNRLEVTPLALYSHGAGQPCWIRQMPLCGGGGQQNTLTGLAGLQPCEGIVNQPDRGSDMTGGCPIRGSATCRQGIILFVISLWKSGLEKARDRAPFSG